MTRAKHVLVVGPSGGGKTTHARKMFATHDGPAIWVNHNGEDVPADAAATGYDELRKLATTDRRARIDYRPQVSGPGAATAPVSVAAGAPGEVMVVADEAANLLPEGATRTDNPLAWALHEGRDEGVVAVPITQDPTELAYPPIKNCVYLVWCGESRNFHRGFRRFYGIEPDELPDDQYKYHVFRPTDPPELVFRGETDPAFAMS